MPHADPELHRLRLPDLGADDEAAHRSVLEVDEVDD